MESLIFILLFVPIIAAIFSFSIEREKHVYLKYLTFGAVTIELTAVVKIVLEVLKSGFYSPWPYFFVDSLGALILIIIMIVGFVAAIYSIGYLKTEVQKNIIGFSRVRQYFVLFNLFLFTMFFAVVSASPIMTWIGIEATTLATAFLISFYNKPSSIEAAWKYLVINSVGLLLGFLGTIIFLAASSNASGGEFVSWKDMINMASGFDPVVAKVAFIFVLIGYGTKMGLAPMHTWLPDAHSKAPVPISALLSGVLLNVAFFAILKFKIVTDLSAGAQFSQNLLISFGLLSIALSALIILVQGNYKRLLAYSSIEHMGIMALGFGFGGIGVFAALLHMVFHSFAKSLLFLASGNIFLKYSTTKIAEVKGVMNILPSTGSFFLVGVLAITGIPPFGIFFTEFYILSAGISKHPLVTTFVIIGLAVVFVGFFRHLSSMLFGNAPAEMKKGESGKWTIIPIYMLLSMLIIFSLVIPVFLGKLLVDAAGMF